MSLSLSSPSGEDLGAGHLAGGVKNVAIGPFSYRVAK